MKKLLYLLLLFVCSSGFAQNFGKYTLTGVIQDNGTKVYEKWIDEKNNSYSMYFDQSPVGIKHASEVVNEILTANALDFGTPTMDKSLLPTYINGFDNLELLYISIKNGESEIVKGWRLNYRNVLLVLKKDRYQVFIN